MGDERALIRNPVPRSERRRSLDSATDAEWIHADRHRDRKDPQCWFCTNRAGEHVGHDFLIEGCPDCASDAKRART